MHRLLTGLAEAFETCLLTFEHHPDSARPSYSQREPGGAAAGHRGAQRCPASGLPARTSTVLQRAGYILSPRSSAWGPYLEL